LKSFLSRRLAGILPTMLARTAQGAPKRAIWLNTGLTSLLVIYVYLVGGASYDLINHASIVCGIFHYLTIFASYIVMKTKYQVGLQLAPLSCSSYTDEPQREVP
jgi:L-asparagine transporter-like permease